jgi:hypothetical protein
MVVVPLAQKVHKVLQDLPEYLEYGHFEQGLVVHRARKVRKDYKGFQERPVSKVQKVL